MMSSSSSSSIVHQFSCFSSINRARHRLYTRHHTQLAQLPNLWSQVRLSVRSDGGKTGISNSQTKTSRSDNPDASSAEAIVNGKETSNALKEEAATETKRAAKIHDFCLGIPFGGIVLTGGLGGFIFTRNISTLVTGVILGCALLALSTFSLKVWRQGESSLPFILGQSVLAFGLLWKNLQTYSLSKKLFPTGFYVIVSAAMICFYSYVVLSGGNPPPKKLKSSVVAPS